MEATIPLVQRNSELGCEPSMKNQCDEADLRWKLKLMDYMLRAQLLQHKKK